VTACGDPRDPRHVGELLDALLEARASDAVSTLATKAASVGMFDLFLKVHADEAPDYLFGREPDGTPSQSWTWQGRPARTAICEQDSPARSTFAPLIVHPLAQHVAALST
jgi:hypothetical protein